MLAQTDERFEASVAARVHQFVCDMHERFDQVAKIVEAKSQTEIEIEELLNARRTRRNKETVEGQQSDPIPI